MSIVESAYSAARPEIGKQTPFTWRGSNMTGQCSKCPANGKVYYVGEKWICADCWKKEKGK